MLLLSNGRQPINPLSPTQISPPKYFWLFGLFILFLTAVFYIHSAQTTYLIADEYLVYRFTRDDLGTTLSYLANSDVHPPLWFTFFWGWRRIVGESDFAGRAQAIMFSVMTLSVVYQLGKRWFGSPRFGLFAMVALAVSGLFFQYALQIRPYGLAMLLASLCMVAFQGWITRPTRHTALFYGASVAALLYVHYFMLLLVLAQGIYFLLLVRPTHRRWGQGILAAGWALLLFVPWLPSFLNQVQHIRQVELESGSARGLAGSSATTQLTSLEEVWKLVQGATNGLVWLYVIVLVVGIWYARRQANYRLALIWAVGLPAVTFAVNLILAVYNPRYIINFMVGFALVMAVGLASLPSRIRWVSVVGFAALNLWAMPTLLPKDIVPYRLLLRQLVAAYRPGDSIFINPPDNRGVEFNWEYGHQFPLEMRQAIVRTADDAMAARRIWYLTPYWLDENIRSTFDEIQQTHPLQRGYGKCDLEWCYLVQLLEAPPWPTAQLFGAEMAFRGADLDMVSRESIQTRLWWQVETVPSKDYSIGLKLSDQNGLVVAGTDGPITLHNNLIYSTSQLTPGQIYIDFRDLALSPSLSPGSYQLSLLVYDWQTNERLLLPDGTDHLELGTIHFD
jgi:hypothetical protein